MLCAGVALVSHSGRWKAIVYVLQAPHPACARYTTAAAADSSKYIVEQAKLGKDSHGRSVPAPAAEKALTDATVLSDAVATQTTAAVRLYNDAYPDMANREKRITVRTLRRRL